MISGQNFGKRKERGREKNMMWNSKQKCLYRGLIFARAKLNFNISDDIVQKLNSGQQKEYEFGNKPGKLLAHKKKEQARRSKLKRPLKQFILRKIR